MRDSRILILLAAFSLAFGLAACGDDDNDDDGSGSLDISVDRPGGDGTDETPADGMETPSDNGTAATPTDNGTATTPSVPPVSDNCPAECADACTTVGHDNVEVITVGQQMACAVADGSACAGEPDAQNQVQVLPCAGATSACIQSVTTQAGFVCVPDVGTCDPNAGISNAAPVCEGDFTMNGCIEDGTFVGVSCTELQLTCDSDQGLCIAAAGGQCQDGFIGCPDGQECTGQAPGQAGTCTDEAAAD